MCHCIYYMYNLSVFLFLRKLTLFNCFDFRIDVLYKTFLTEWNEGTERRIEFSLPAFTMSTRCARSVRKSSDGFSWGNTQIQIFLRLKSDSRGQWWFFTFFHAPIRYTNTPVAFIKAFKPGSNVFIVSKRRGKSLRQLIGIEDIGAPLTRDLDSKDRRRQRFSMPSMSNTVKLENKL